MTAITEYTGTELAIPEIAADVRSEVRAKLKSSNDELAGSMANMQAQLAAVLAITQSAAWGIVSLEYKALMTGDAVTLRLGLDQLVAFADQLVVAANAVDALAAARAALED